LTIVLATLQAKRRGERDASEGAKTEQVAIRMGVSQGVVLLFFVALMTIVWPLDARQFNALISLFWACTYMGVGVWVGMRLFWIGAITAVAILFGYFNIE
jgi:hypothetical protein